MRFGLRRDDGFEGVRINFLPRSLPATSADSCRLPHQIRCQACVLRIASLCGHVGYPARSLFTRAGILAIHEATTGRYPLYILLPLLYQCPAPTTIV